LELIGLISLLTGMSGIGSSLWFRNDLCVLGERRLSSVELVHDVFNGLLLGIIPTLVRPRSRTDLRHWFFLDL
jgi:hypothetical protein